MIFLILLVGLVTAFPGCENAGFARKDVFVFPDGFKGPAIVVYNVKGAAGSSMRGENRVFNVPKDGICLVSDKMLERSSFPEFFYGQYYDDIKPIARHDYYAYPQFREGKPDTTGPNTTQVFGWMGTKGAEFKKKEYYKYYELIVASRADLETLDTSWSALHDSVRARVSR